MQLPPSDDWQSCEAGIVSGEVLVAGNEMRSRLFDRVEADRHGPLTRRLLTFTTDPRLPVRRTIVELFAQLSFRAPDWPSVADAAEVALGDVDPQVRRTAATLLVQTAAPGRATAALTASSDPVARVALMDALTGPPLSRTPADWEGPRSDSVPAVRLLATIATYRRDAPADWPALDAAVRADLDASGDFLDAPGSYLLWTPAERWARVFTRLDREQDCYAWAQRLADRGESPRIRLEGVRMAAAAMREWRAAPGRLTPTLAGLLSEEPSEVRAAALHVLAASLAASRLAADDLAVVLDDPELGGPAAVALGCAGDHRAVPHLVRLMLADSDAPRLDEAFRAVARAGADPQAPVAAARRVLAALPDPDTRVLPLRVLAAFGPAAAAAVPELVATLEVAGDHTPDCAIRVLGRIGPAAAAAVPLLRRFSTPGAALALLRITSDRTVADRHLAGRPADLRRGGTDAALLTWLAEHGGLTARQHEQLRSLFRRPGFAQLESAGALWLHEGPAAAGELLEVLPEYLSDDLFGRKALPVLAAMGRYARPLLDGLDRFVASRHRAGIRLGDEDAEMRADEVLLAATIAAREQIAG